MKMWRIGLAFGCLGLGLAAAAQAEVISISAGNSSALQSALNSASDGDIIELQAGTYIAPFDGFSITNPNARFTVRGAAPAPAVILSGAGANPIIQYQVNNAALAGTVIFQDLVFRDGLSSQNGVMGGVTVNLGNARFERCHFEDNGSDAGITGGGGAGVFFGTAFFDECVFDGNWATQESGGLRIGGSARVFIHRSQFIDNRSNLAGHRPSATGGGIGIVDGFLCVTNTRFDSNESSFAGGGIYALSPWSAPFDVPRSEVWVANSTFVDNKVEPASGINTPSPSEGGAMHGENQIFFKVMNSRFDTNIADIGGAINTLRGEVIIENSAFRGNKAQEIGASVGFGGAIAANSNDGPEDGTTNRPLADVTVRDSFILGRFGSTGVVSQASGGIHATGDQNRHYGLQTVIQGGTLADNRMPLMIDNVIFADLDVAVTTGIGGTGAAGGLSSALTDMTLTDSMFLGCDSTGTGGTAGALRVITEATAQISGTVVAGNTADRRAGGLWMQGAEVDVDDSAFIHNEITDVSQQNFGAAIFAAQLDNFAGQALAMTGTVSSSLFSENTGTPIFDDDRHNGPINDVRYNSNTFFRDMAGTTIYSHAISGNKTAATLNTLVVNRTGAANTDKSQVNNSQLGAKQTFGAISHAPLEILDTTAAGDPESETAAFFGYAWSGGSATINGGAAPASQGWQAAGSGTHTLSVDGQDFTTTVNMGATPAASLSANPPEVGVGDTTTLTWSVDAGTFQKAELDFLGEVAASGTMQVTISEETTFGLFVMTEEGGVTQYVTVTTLLFADGFETGNTSGWSSTVN